MTIWQPELDRTQPLYLAIADAMLRDVEGGVLREGTRLPPQRDLAWKLGVTLGTVTRGYKEAEKRGLLEGEVGRGSYIRKRPQVSNLTPAALERDGTIDLSHAIPPPVVKPEELDQAMQSVMRDPRRLDLLDYAPPDGFHMHRSMAVQWLKRSGIDVSDNNVVISAGAHLGLVTVLEAVGEGQVGVLAEKTNYAQLFATFKNTHLNPLAVEMDEDGLLPDAFEQRHKTTGCRLLYIVPTLQNPTTHTMSAARREAIVAIARKYDITIIEDDIFRLLDARVQPPTFYELAPERTFHITSLSKTLAPGLRIGFVVSPRGQERVLKSHMRNMAARTVGISGEIARYWIETDVASDILDRTRMELAVRRNLFTEIFKSEDFRCAPGAPYAWLKLPEHWQPKRFAQTLAARNIRLTPGNRFELEVNAPSQHVRICFGQPKLSWHMREAFETIVALMNDGDADDFTPVA
jgi:DNA-binding transcriptional MocR family regulator